MRSRLLRPRHEYESSIRFPASTRRLEYFQSDDVRIVPKACESVGYRKRPSPTQTGMVNFFSPSSRHSPSQRLMAPSGERYLNPRAGRVSPVGNQPSSLICDRYSRVRVAPSGYFEAVFMAVLNHNPLPLKRRGCGSKVEKLNRVTRRCEGLMTAVITRKPVTPPWRSALSAKKASASQFRLLARILCHYCYGDSRKPNMRLMLKWWTGFNQSHSTIWLVAACACIISSMIRAL